MVESEALDIAAKAAGRPCWAEAKRNSALPTIKSIEAHAATLIREAELIEQREAYKAEVSEAVTALIAAGKAHDAVRPVPGKGQEFRDHCRAVDNLRRFIIPAADPLAQVLRDTALIGADTFEARADEMRTAAERLGYTLKLERLDQ